jgi:hypothetical protein
MVLPGRPVRELIAAASYDFTIPDNRCRYPAIKRVSRWVVDTCEFTYSKKKRHRSVPSQTGFRAAAESYCQRIRVTDWHAVSWRGLVSARSPGSDLRPNANGLPQLSMCRRVGSVLTIQQGTWALTIPAHHERGLSKTRFIKRSNVSSSQRQSADSVGKL